MANRIQLRRHGCHRPDEPSGLPQRNPRHGQQDAANAEERRRFPRILQLVGVAGCGTLVLTLPLRAVLGGALVFAVGVVYRAIRVRFSRPRS